VLHLCSDYARQRLYPELFAAIHDAGIAQAVYVPVRTAAELAIARPPRSAIGYHARHVLRPYHRLLFRTKVRDVHRDLLRLEDPHRYALVHAHFLFSDGAVAWRLAQHGGPPFIAAVRNTDLNVFMRVRPDLRGLMLRVATAAKALVFLSPSYREQFLARLPFGIARALEARCHVIPNGIDSLWLEAPPPARRGYLQPLKILYVGDFSANKNLLRLLEAASNVAAQRPVSLTLVGGGGNGAKAVAEAIGSGRFPFVRAIGRVDNAVQLRALYRDHDVFAMPSHCETFGLVYVEAWSQGLPVVLARGQGVDGYFPSGTVAEAVDPMSVPSIARGIEALAERATEQRESCIAAARLFSWSRVAAEYRTLYSTVASNVETA
jgi:glycosyltransferase involved in cell wall biosynthesis